MLTSKTKFESEDKYLWLRCQRRSYRKVFVVCFIFISWIYRSIFNVKWTGRLIIRLLTGTRTHEPNLQQLHIQYTKIETLESCHILNWLQKVSLLASLFCFVLLLIINNALIFLHHQRTSCVGHYYIRHHFFCNWTMNSHILNDILSHYQCMLPKFKFHVKQEFHVSIKFNLFLTPRWVRNSVGKYSIHKLTRCLFASNLQVISKFLEK